MRRWIAIACIPVTMAVVHPYLLDGLDGALLSLLLGENTRFAAGYSDGGFRRIEVGMTEAQVIAILGDPLRKNVIFGVMVFGYSESPTEGNYKFRTIVLGRDGRVTKKSSGLAVD